MTSPESQRAVGPGFHACALLGLALACGLAYASALDAGFHLDDVQNVLQNPRVQWRALDLETLTGSLRGNPAPRPVAYLSFGLNHYLGGLEPSGYHFLNLLIHLGNAILVYALARATLVRAPGGVPGRLAWAALGGALLFAVHPLQTQSVTYVVQRMNSLAALFYLSGLLLYLRGRSRRGPARALLWSAALVAWILAMGSKEIAFPFFAALWLYEWYFFRDLDGRWARRSLPLLGMAYALLGAGAYLLYGGAEAFEGYRGAEVSLVARALTQLRAVALYLSLVALPLPSRLNLTHDLPASSSLLEPPTTLLALLLVATLLLLAIGWARRERLLSFALLWFFLHLAVESSVLPLAPVYEHRTYLPMAGVALAAGRLLLAGLRWRPVVAAAAALALLACLTLGTRERNRVWRSDLSLWSDAVAKSPRHTGALVNLAVALAARGRNRESLELYDRALQIEPDDPIALSNAGAELLALDRPEEALLRYRQALRLAPDSAGLHREIAAPLTRLGRLDEAEEHLLEALRRDPDPELWTRLGDVRAARGRARRARDSYARALELDPEHGRASVNLAWLLATSGDPALRDPERAVRLAEAGAARADSDPRVLDALAAAYASAARFGEAARTAERAAGLAERSGAPGLAAKIRSRVALYREGRALGVAAPAPQP